MSFLDPFLGTIARGAEVTHLGAIVYGAEVLTRLACAG
jgi:tRNA G10  N-methylase Trm11